MIRRGKAPSFWFLCTTEYQVEGRKNIYPILRLNPFKKQLQKERRQKEGLGLTLGKTMFVHSEEAYSSPTCVDSQNAYNVVSYEVEMNENDLHSLHGEQGSVIFQEDTVIPNTENIWKCRARDYICFMLRTVSVRRASSEPIKEGSSVAGQQSYLDWLKWTRHLPPCIPKDLEIIIRGL